MDTLILAKYSVIETRIFKISERISLEHYTILIRRALLGVSWTLTPLGVIVISISLKG